MNAASSTRAIVADAVALLPVDRRRRAVMALLASGAVAWYLPPLLKMSSRQRQVELLSLRRKAKEVLMIVMLAVFGSAARRWPALQRLMRIWPPSNDNLRRYGGPLAALLLLPLVPVVLTQIKRTELDTEEEESEAKEREERAKRLLEALVEAFKIDRPQARKLLLPIDDGRVLRQIEHEEAAQVEKDIKRKSKVARQRVVSKIDAANESWVTDERLAAALRVSHGEIDAASSALLDAYCAEFGMQRSASYGGRPVAAGGDESEDGSEGEGEDDDDMSEQQEGEGEEAEEGGEFSEELEALEAAVEGDDDVLKTAHDNLRDQAFLGCRGACQYRRIPVSLLRAMLLEKICDQTIEGSKRGLTLYKDGKKLRALAGKQNGSIFMHDYTGPSYHLETLHQYLEPMYLPRATEEWGDVTVRNDEERATVTQAIERLEAAQRELEVMVEEMEAGSWKIVRKFAFGNMSRVPFLVGAGLFGMLTSVLNSLALDQQGELVNTMVNAAANSKLPGAQKASTVVAKSLLGIMTLEILVSLSDIWKRQLMAHGISQLVTLLKKRFLYSLLSRDLQDVTAMTKTNEMSMYEQQSTMEGMQNMIERLLQVPESVLSSSVNTLSTMAIVYQKSPKLMGVMFLAIPAEAFVNQLVQWLRRKFQKFLEKQHPVAEGGRCFDDELLSDADSFTTMRTFAREKDCLKLFMKDLKMENVYEQDSTLCESAFTPLTTLTSKLAQMVGLWSAGNLVLAGELSPGEVIQMVSLATQAVQRLRDTWKSPLGSHRGGGMQQLVDVLETIEAKPRIGLDSPPEEEMAALCPDGLRGDIDFRGVRFSYADRKAEVHQGLSFAVRSGQTCGIIGESGGGKSTIFPLILRLYDVDSGEILIDGRPIKAYNPAWLRKQIVLVSQEPHLVWGTIKENITFGCTEGEEPSDDEIKQAMRDAEIYDDVFEGGKFPKTWETYVDSRMVSGGQKQRIAIARALILKPKILLLDEATSALDPVKQGNVLAALERLMRSGTVITIAQKMPAVKDADTIVALSKCGRAIEQGPPQELLAKESRYADNQMCQWCQSDPLCSSERKAKCYWNVSGPRDERDCIEGVYRNYLRIDATRKSGGGGRRPDGGSPTDSVSLGGSGNPGDRQGSDGSDDGGGWRPASEFNDGEEERSVGGGEHDPAMLRQLQLEGQTLEKAVGILEEIKREIRLSGLDSAANPTLRRAFADLQRCLGTSEPSGASSLRASIAEQVYGKSALAGLGGVSQLGLRIDSMSPVTMGRSVGSVEFANLQLPPSVDVAMRKYRRAGLGMGADHHSRGASQSPRRSSGKHAKESSTPRGGSGGSSSNGSMRSKTLQEPPLSARFADAKGSTLLGALPELRRANSHGSHNSLANGGKSKGGEFCRTQTSGQ